MTKKMNYDSAYNELKDIVNKLQDENLSIELLSSYLKRAHELKNFCQKRLREIEKEVDEATFDEPLPTLDS